MKIYLASSWRNERYEDVLQELRAAGFDVYDFRNRETAFHWNDIDPKWQEWDVERFIEGLKHPLARKGFNTDFWAMKDADVCVLLLPCGRSAHLEAGWCLGAAKKVIILLDDSELEPELMYAMADELVRTVPEAIERLRDISRFRKEAV